MNNGGLATKASKSCTWKTRQSCQVEVEKKGFFYYFLCYIYIGVLLWYMLSENTLDLEHNGMTCCLYGLQTFIFHGTKSCVQK